MEPGIGGLLDPGDDWHGLVVGPSINLLRVAVLDARPLQFTPRQSGRRMARFRPSDVATTIVHSGDRRGAGTRSRGSRLELTSSIRPGFGCTVMLSLLNRVPPPSSTSLSYRKVVWHAEKISLRYLAAAVRPTTRSMTFVPVSPVRSSPSILSKSARDVPKLPDCGHQCYANSTAPAEVATSQHA